MLWKNKSLNACKLYIVLDKRVCKENIFKIAKLTADGGADIIQYRDKESDDKTFIENAKRLKLICHQSNIPFIVNDRVEIALRITADGIHLGQDDLPLSVAKKLFKNKIVGVSCKNLTDAKESISKGADYFGTGAIFTTATKDNPKYISINTLREISRLGLPTFAIGGINLDNLNLLTNKGLNKVAICSGICKAGDILQETRLIKNRLIKK